MNADKLLELQMQVRQNSDEMKSYISDLNSWENEMKVKEQEELNQKSGKKDNQKLPPVRNKSLLKNKHPQKSKSPKAISDQKSDKIKGWDYKAWDKFDVDKACKEIDANSGSDKDEEEDEEKKLKETAERSHALKEQGNEYFRQQKYMEAIESYSQALVIDPDNSVLYANRAMSLIKQEKWTAAESDCTESLKIDSRNVKALLRRGTSRIQLKKFEEAMLDFREVLLLEPANKQARVELDKLKGCKNASQKLNDNNQMPNSIPSSSSSTTTGDSVVKGLVVPIDKPISDRSKKPLKRIKIEEVGIETSNIMPSNSSSSSSSSQFSIRSKQKDDDVFSKFLKECSNVKKETVSEDGEDGGTKSNEQLEASSVAASNEPRKDCGDSREILSIDTSNNDNGNVTELSTKIPNLIEEINGSVPKLSLLSPSTSSEITSSQLNLSLLPQTSETTTTTTTTTTKSVSNSSSVRYLPPPSTTTTAKTESMLFIPQVPTTSFQFQSDWKHLKNKDFEFFCYFKNIEPSHYRNLFGEAFESDMLHKIICTLHTYYIKENLDAYKVLFYLTSVKRFPMIVMFLSSSDKSLLKEIFAKISVGGAYSVDDVNQLKMMFEL